MQRLEDGALISDARVAMSEGIAAGAVVRSRMWLLCRFSNVRIPDLTVEPRAAITRLGLQADELLDHRLLAAIAVQMWPM